MSPARQHTHCCWVLVVVKPIRRGRKLAHHATTKVLARQKPSPPFAPRKHVEHTGPAMPSVPPTRYDKVPIKVAKVQLNAVDSNGNKGRTKSSFVRTLCADIVKARTMKELMEGLSTAVSAMSGLGIYKTVDVELDKSSKPLNPGV